MKNNSRHAGKAGFGSVNTNSDGADGKGGVVSKGSGKGKPSGGKKLPKNRSAEVGNKSHNSSHGRWC